MVPLVPCHTVAQSADAYLWEIRHRDNVLYIFGGIHFGRADFYPLPASVENAYHISKGLAVEVDLSSTKVIVQMEALVKLAPPHKLRQMISADLMRDLTEQLSQFDLVGRRVTGLKPWALAFTLNFLEAERLGYDSIWGVDRYFLARAKREKKSIVQLETVRDQFADVDAMSQDDQLELLLVMVQQLSNGTLADEVQQMADAWHRGDWEMFDGDWRDRSAQHPILGEVDRKLISNRNAKMASGLSKLLMGKKTFFAVVGVEHVVGEGSVIALLQQKGFDVKRIGYPLSSHASGVVEGANEVSH